MEIRTKSADGVASIILGGRFDFNVNREFKTAYEPFLSQREVRILEIAFGNVEFIDSSALGMLLVLRDKAQAASKSVKLVQTRDLIRQVLEIAHFERFFEIT